MAKAKSLGRQRRSLRALQRQRYYLATLGAALLSRVGRHRVPVLGPGKLLSLLAVLACRPGRRAGTDALVELLWSERDAVVGHHDLRQALWQLRRRLGRGSISCSRGEVALRARLTVDRDEFLKAVARGALVRATTLYRGDFLARSSAPPSAALEQWIGLEAYRLRQLFVRAAEVVVRRWAAGRRFGTALDLARRARDADTLGEVGWGLVLVTLLGMGDRVQANAEADVWERSATRPLSPGASELVRQVRAMVPVGETSPRLLPGLRHPQTGSPAPKGGSRLSP